MAAPLYIESRIRADLDALWAATQDPAQHRRWDLRFTHIDYLNGDHLGAVDVTDFAADPRQWFTYEVRVLGIKLSGAGVCTGERRRPDGTRTSALAFASPHPLSLLAEGTGYWRYVPTADGIRFLTGYDYRPRWGRFGRIADRLVFRPLIGWATAWSFDRLRIWLEYGIPPERSARYALINSGLRAAVHAAAMTIAATTSVLAPLDGRGPYGSVVFGLGVTAALVFLPPPPGTPAARRTLRRRPATVSAPAILDRLEPLP